MSLADPIVSVIVSILASLMSYRLKAVSASGAFGVLLALIVGSLAFGLAAPIYIVAILAESSFVTRFGYGKKKELGAEEKGEGARDIWRVLGGAGASVVVALFVISKLLPLDIGTAGFVVSLTITSSDTWASEIGVLSTEMPRLLSPGFPRTERGVSGGITAVGEVASFLGAAFGILIALILGLLWSDTPSRVVVVFGCALVAEHVDSLLGATVQEAYYCPHCQLRTDKRIHTCGTITNLVRGNPFITNTRVNLVSTLIGASLTVLLFEVFP